MKPFRNASTDIAQAIKFVAQEYPEFDLEIAKTLTQEKRSMSTKRIAGLDTFRWRTHAPFRWGELRNAARDDAKKELALYAAESGRAKNWPDRALGWLDTGFPAVIVVEGVNKETVLADGRGRLTVAYAFGVPEMHVVYVKAERRGGAGSR